MLSDYIDEFLRRIYKPKECRERLPKFENIIRIIYSFFVNLFSEILELTKSLIEMEKKKLKFIIKIIIKEENLKMMMKIMDLLNLVQVRKMQMKTKIKKLKIILKIKVL